MDQINVATSPLSKRIEDIVNAVWRAQKFNRRLRIDRNELLDILKQVSFLEKRGASGTPSSSTVAIPALVEAMLPDAVTVEEPKKNTPIKKGK